MNDSQLARRLADTNLWWVNPAWELDDPDLRPLRDNPFDYRPDPLRGIAPDGLYLLLGPRRVGKSVEIKRAIAALVEGGINPRAVVFVSCDGLRANDLRRMLHVARNLARTIPGRRYWFIDEVTAVEGWSAIIKHERDQTQLRTDCVVLSGSSSRGLQEAVADLAGRRGTDTVDTERVLLPMSFRDFCRATGGVDGLLAAEPMRPRDVFPLGAGALDDLSIHWPGLADRWELFVRIGGYPRAVRGFVETGAVPAAFARDLWDVVRGEAFRSIQMAAPETLALLARLAEALCSPVNASDVARDLGIGSHHQVEARIVALVSAFLGMRCYRDENGAVNFGARRKFYFTDPLLARLAHEIDADHPEPDASAISEQQLAVALARAFERERQGALIEGTEVRYWVSEATRKEIDFVGPRIGTGFESKYVDQGWRGEARTLIARGPGGVVATRGVYSRDADAFAIPIGMLVWLIGG